MTSVTCPRAQHSVSASVTGVNRSYLTTYLPTYPSGLAAAKKTNPLPTYPTPPRLHDTAPTTQQRARSSRPEAK
eukprot:4886170-Prymnesium_polylepis.1